MEKLKKAYTKLLELLGLKTPPPPPPPPPTRLQQMLKKFNTVEESQKQQFVDSTIADAMTGILEAQKLVASQTQDVVLPTSNLHAQVAAGLEYVDVASHFLKIRQAPEKAAGPETIDELSVLQGAFKLLVPLAVPGKAWLTHYEQYVEKYEEQLLLIEARGDYKFKISENKEWIKVPALQFLQGKGVGKAVAEKELLQFFYDCPQARLFELDTRVPMLPTSLIDVQMLITSKRVVPLYVKEQESWYLLVV